MAKKIKSKLTNLFSLKKGDVILYNTPYGKTSDIVEKVDNKKIYFISKFIIPKQLNSEKYEILEINGQVLFRDGGSIYSNSAYTPAFALAYDSHSDQMIDIMNADRESKFAKTYGYDIADEFGDIEYSAKNDADLIQYVSAMADENISNVAEAKKYLHSINFSVQEVNYEHLPAGRKGYAKGGSLEERLEVKQIRGSWTVYDKKLKTNYGQSTSERLAQGLKDDLIARPKTLKLYEQQHKKGYYEKGGSVQEGGSFDWYDFDKKMALINLNQINEYAVKLDNIVTEDTELEEWVKMKLTRIEQNVADVKKSLEGWEKFEKFGAGGRIFKKQLLHIAKYSKDLIEMIKLGSKLMSWQENKLAISAEYIDSVYHHLDYEMGNRASDMKFAKGGYIESLEKELKRLQRELNSPRLGTYIEGDNSEEAKALRQEREVKLARFNEVLQLMREKENNPSDNNTFVNVLLNYGFTEARSSHGVRFFNNTNGYFAFVDMKGKNVEVFKEAKAGTNYSGFSVQSLIKFLDEKGFKKKFEDGGAVVYAKGDTVKENQLFKAVSEDGKIKIYEKGLPLYLANINDVEAHPEWFNDKYLYSVSASELDEAFKELEEESRSDAMEYQKEFVGVFKNGGGINSAQYEVNYFESKLKPLFKEKNKWHFLDETVNGKNVKLKFFVGQKEVDVQVFTINGVSASMPKNYVSATQTLNMILENFKTKFGHGGEIDVAPDDSDYQYMKWLKEKKGKRKKIMFGWF